MNIKLQHLTLSRLTRFDRTRGTCVFDWEDQSRSLVGASDGIAGRVG